LILLGKYAQPFISFCILKKQTTMKKLFLLLLLGIIACDQNDLYENCTPEGFFSTVTTNQKIEKVFNAELQRNVYNIINGDQLLFAYTLVGAQCDDIIDDEWGEQLLFKIDPGISAFDITDDEVLTTNCFYNQFGVWVSHEQTEVNKGRIEGVKISENQWRVNVSVEVISPLSNTPKRIEFSRIYTVLLLVD